jgi:hypothetical protein
MSLHRLTPQRQKHAPLLLEALSLEGLAVEHVPEALLDLALERLRTAATVLAGVRRRAAASPAERVVRLARADARRAAVRLVAGPAVTTVGRALVERNTVALAVAFAHATLAHARVVVAGAGTRAGGAGQLCQHQLREIKADGHTHTSAAVVALQGVTAVRVRAGRSSGRSGLVVVLLVAEEAHGGFFRKRGS